MEKEIDFNKVGEIDPDSIFFKTLKKEFKNFPVRWANSKDLLYAMPYDRDDFLIHLVGEKAERLKKEEKERKFDPTQKWKRKPWTYQEGRIFKVRLIKTTAKAYLLAFSFGKSWVPKGQVDLEDGEVWLPKWLIKDKGLEEKDAKVEPPFEWEPGLKELGKVIIPPKKEMKRK